MLDTLTPVGPGRVCHIHAEGRDHVTAGRFTIRLRTSGKVRNFQSLLFSSKFVNYSGCSCGNKT